MKKLLSIILCFTMLYTGTMLVYAAENTNIVKTEFYVQRFGVQMDEDGTVGSREQSYFTPCVYTDKLTAGVRSEDYSIVYKEGVVSSDDVINEIVNKPDDAAIFSLIKSTYENKGYILSSDGKVVDWSKFTVDNYEMRWYVLKMEDIWHVDGVIVEKDTQDPVQIPSEDDPDYIPPEEVGKDDNNDTDEKPEIPDIPEYTSNFAYIFGYNDTTMGAEGSLLRCEVSAMIHRLVKQNNKLGGFSYNASNPPVFADIGGEWFRSAIEYMNYQGAFNTDEGGMVLPYAPVTRGETFKLVCLGLGFTENAEYTYDDYANIMQSAGYIQGDENGNLNVSKLITRAEFCTIYNRVIGRENASLITADGEEIMALEATAKPVEVTEDFEEKNSSDSEEKEKEKKEA